MALAGGHGHGHKTHKVKQTQLNNTEQSNTNYSPVYQFNLGSGKHENNAVVKPQLSNDNETYQDQESND